MLDTVWPSEGSDYSAPGDRRLGLALSGGGLRAALLHVGVLARLAELDRLREVEVLAGVGGGALTSALYYLHLKRVLEAEGDLDSPRLIGLVGAVEQDLLALAAQDLASRCHASLRANLRLAWSGGSLATRLGELLDQRLFAPAAQSASGMAPRLRDLAIWPRGDVTFNPVTDNQRRHCKVPLLVLQATSLTTGHGWRFESARMGEPWPGADALRLDRSPRLAPAAYDQLAEPAAALTLGQAVAACLAAPSLLPPLPLAGLYRDPERPDAAGVRLDLRLADGSLQDPLGCEILRERGCSHYVLSDGAGEAGEGSAPGAWPGALLGRCNGILEAQLRALQLARLSAAAPGRVALIHLAQELAVTEVTPDGPASAGTVVVDRAEHEVTSYGVQRGLQRLLARLAGGLGPVGETAACALMADAYLLAGRALLGAAQANAEPAATAGAPWRFAAVIGALAKPTPALLGQLHAARAGGVGWRLPWLRHQLACLALLGLGGGLALWWSRAGWPPAADWAPGLMLLALLGLILAYPALLALRLAAADGGGGRLARPLALVDRALAVLAALPLSLAAKHRLWRQRRSMAAARLTTLGLTPPTPTATQDPRPPSQPMQQDPAERAA